MASGLEGLVIRQVPYGHPDGSSLTTEVQEYYVSIYGSPDSDPMPDDEFVPPRGAFFVAYADGAALAMGGWRLHAPIDGHDAARPAEIKRMYVVRSARRRGLARLMLGHLEASARAAGADSMVLETGLVQPDAVALYRACGYVDIARFGHYAHQPDSVHLARPL